MAKKVSQTLTAELRKNVIMEKGGAWMLQIKVVEEGTVITEGFTAWANASAAKRYLKQFVVSFTPRKSIKMEVIVKDVPTDKPLVLEGSLTYKVEERA